MSIRLRIALLVGLAILGAAAFMGVEASSASRIGRALEAQEAYGRLSHLATHALAASQRLRILTEHFIRERDSAATADFHAEHEDLIRALGQAATFAEDAEGRAVLEEIRTAVSALGADFQKVEDLVRALGLTEEDGLRGRLRKSVKAMEQELVMWPNVSQLMVPMLQMRQAEKDFMIYGSPQYLGNHARFTAQFDMALESSPLPSSVRADFAKLLAVCGADMKAYGETDLALKGAVESLRVRQTGLRPLMERFERVSRAGLESAVVQQQTVRAEAAVLSIVLGIALLLGLVTGGALIAMGIVRPLRGIENAMAVLADGDHQSPVPFATRRDEIGDMARAVEVFRRNAAEMSRIQSEMDRVRQEAEAASRGRVLALASAFENTVRTVAEVVSSRAMVIHDHAGGIAGNGAETKSDALSLRIAEAAEQARHSVVAITDAAAELGQSVGEVAENGRAVGEAAETAVCELTRAEMRVRGLSETAERIDRVVGMISDLAQRTNMLSMNATIEAARAGEAGQGFAVVAAEVKRLANQTADSARGIASDVAAIQTATAETVAGIADVGAAIRRMDQLAVTVRASVVRQEDVARRIERCVAEVADETRVLSDGVASFTHAAARQCGAAAQVLWAAEDLAAPTRTLQDEVAGFLSTVRAA